MYALVPDHPYATKNGYVLFHRVIVENKISRLLTRLEIVHHKDGDRHNNNISNLEVMLRSDHSRMHKLGSGHGDVRVECANCQRTIFVSYNTRPGTGTRKNRFCSRKCNGEYQQKNKWHP